MSKEETVELNENYQFGEKVKEIRIKEGLTQGQVAKELNVTPGFISNIENGRTAMSLRLLIYYATLTGVSLDSLVGLIDAEYEEDALDKDIAREVQKMSKEDKKKLLKVLKIMNE